MLKVKQTGYLHRITALFLCALLVIICSVPAFAADEIDTAVSYLTQRGIYKGDAAGNLGLDGGLTRAELAAVLTRLDFASYPDEWEDWGEARFTDPDNRYNTFTDIPNWALPYIEYCYQFSYIKGTTATQFDPQGAVTPKMACTVMLRYCGVADTDWSYDTSVEKAQSVGIAPIDGMNGEVIKRGTMAVIIYRSIRYAEQISSQTQTAPVPAEVQVVATPEEPAVMTIDEMKAEIIRLTNIERVKAGVPELEVLPALMDCAQAKAQDMLDNHYYGHASPVYGTANEMIRAFVPNVTGGGENIVAWRDTPKEALDSWMDSQGHRTNVLDNRYRHIGIGIVISANGEYWWVQQFTF